MDEVGPLDRGKAWKAMFTSLSLELILIVEGNYSRNLGREVPPLDLHFKMGVHIGNKTEAELEKELAWGLAGGCCR